MVEKKFKMKIHQLNKDCSKYSALIQLIKINEVTAGISGRLIEFQTTTRGGEGKPSRRLGRRLH